MLAFCLGLNMLNQLCLKGLRGQQSVGSFDIDGFVSSQTYYLMVYEVVKIFVISIQNRYHLNYPPWGPYHIFDVFISKLFRVWRYHIFDVFISKLFRVWRYHIFDVFISKLFRVWRYHIFDVFISKLFRVLHKVKTIIKSYNMYDIKWHKQRYTKLYLHMMVVSYPTYLQAVISMNTCNISRDYSEHVPSQWETMLHSSIVSHWLGAYTKCSLWKTSNAHYHII